MLLVLAAAMTPMCAATSASLASRAAPCLDLAQRQRRGARLAMHRARRPVELAQRIEHRAADADAGIGFEARAAPAGVVLRRLEQSHHAGLHQIVDLHLRRQTAGQVIGDALDQIGVLAHQRVHDPAAAAQLA